MNGRGVLSSKKRGRLMATLEPLRRLMLAVRVLSMCQIIRWAEVSMDLREPYMGISYFLG